MRIQWLLLALLICYCTAAPISLFHHHRHSDNRTIKPANKASTIPSIVKRITDTTTKSQALRRSTSSIRSSTGKAGLDRIAPGLDVLRVELVNLIRDLNNFEPVEDDVVAWTVLNHLNKMAIAHESLLDTLTTNYKLVKKLGWHSDTYRTLLALDDTWRVSQLCSIPFLGLSHCRTSSPLYPQRFQTTQSTSPSCK